MGFWDGNCSMSYDLAFWFEEARPTLEHAADVYDRITDGETGVVQPAAQLDAFYEAVITTFGDLTTLEDADSVPWSDPVERTPESVITTISFARWKAVVPDLLALAEKHGVIAFDPQRESVHHW